MLNHAVAIRALGCKENKICGVKLIPSVRLVCMIGGEGKRGGSCRCVRYSSLRQKHKISELTASWGCLFFIELCYNSQSALENR